MAKRRHRSANPDPVLYPVVLKPAGWPCLVVGGGRLALHKAADLLAGGARVVAVAPAWRVDFSPLALRPEFSRITRRFSPADLEGIRLVVAATDDRPTQEAVAREAERRGILCNVVDVPDLCNFYVPAILRRGDLMVAVTTAGKCPLFAASVRDYLARRLGSHLETALKLIGEGRSRIRARHPRSPRQWRKALDRLLTAPALEHLWEGRPGDFAAHWRSWRSREGI
jgi:precorrin-2 dehydrogenase